MPTRWLSVSVLAVLALSMTSAGIAHAVVSRSSHPVPLAGVVEREVARIHQGPSVECGSDYCGIGTIKPVRFGFDDFHGRYAAVVTVSTNFRTSKYADAAMTLTVENAKGRNQHVFPQRRPLPAGTTGSTTVQWSVKHLQANRVYRVTIGVNAPFGGDHHVSARLHAMTVIFDAQH